MSKHTDDAQPESAPEKYSSGHPQQDEISLADIGRILARQWKWIFSITVTVIIGVIVYDFVSPCVYRAEVFLLSPHSNDIEELNIPDLEQVTHSRDTEELNVPATNQITVDDVYQEMLKNLESLSLRRRFFDEHNIVELLVDKREGDVSEDEIFKTQFSDRMNVNNGKGTESDSVIVSLEGKDPSLLAEWLNGFVSLANAYTIESIIEGIEKKVNARKADLKNRIENMRRVAKQHRLDRIVALDEAIAIARQLGIVESSNRSNSLAMPSNSDSSSVEVTVNIAQSPLYLRGVKELTAEKEILLKRKNDDAFIENFRELQENLAGLDQIKIEMSKVKAVRVDQDAIPPEISVKPKLKLIVVLGGLFGLILGFFVAFLKNYVEQQHVNA